MIASTLCAITQRIFSTGAGVNSTPIRSCCAGSSPRCRPPVRRAWMRNMQNGCATRAPGLPGSTRLPTVPIVAWAAVLPCKARRSISSPLNLVWPTLSGIKPRSRFVTPVIRNRWRASRWGVRATGARATPRMSTACCARAPNNAATCANYMVLSSVFRCSNSIPARRPSSSGRGRRKSCVPPSLRASRV